MHDVRPLNLSTSGGVDETQSVLSPVQSLETGQPAALDVHEDMEHVLELGGLYILKFTHVIDHN